VRDDSTEGVSAVRQRRPVREYRPFSPPASVSRREHRDAEKEEKPLRDFDHRLKSLLRGSDFCSAGLPTVGEAA